MEGTFVADCSTCGELYGPFGSFSEAENHADNLRNQAHDCDATEKPMEASNLPLTDPGDHRP